MSDCGAPAELHPAIDSMQIVVQPGLYVAQLSTWQNNSAINKMISRVCSRPEVVTIYQNVCSAILGIVTPYNFGELKVTIRYPDQLNPNPSSLICMISLLYLHYIILHPQMGSTHIPRSHSSSFRALQLDPRVATHVPELWDFGMRLGKAVFNGG